MAKFRDPVHNLIPFDQQEDHLYVDLINTREFQRLRHIRQLGMSNYTYTGAEHTRFAHSLGVAYLMKRFIDHLAHSEFLETRRYAEELVENRQLAVAAALLHDVGHGPFSHELEQLTGERHELWTIRILQGPTEVRQVLEGFRTGMADEIAEVIRRTHPSRLLVKLLSSQLDVDRMDYLLRDSLMTGARYGQFDLEWLINTLRIGVVNGQPEVGLDLHKGKSVAEDFVMARYYMYQHVYLHKTTRSADLMVEKVFERALELAHGDGSFQLPLELARLLMTGDVTHGTHGTRGKAENRAKKAANPAAEKGGMTDLANYLGMTDHTIWNAFYQWRWVSDPILAGFCDRVINRRLYKEIPFAYRNKFREKLVKDMRQIEAEEGIPVKYLFLEDETRSSPYTDTYLVGGRGPQRQWDAGGQGIAVKPTGEEEASQNIYLFDRQGRAYELSETSEIIRTVRNQHTAIRRIYVPELIRDRLIRQM